MASLSEFDREQAILLDLDEHGRVEVGERSMTAVDDILSLPQVHALDQAHAQEHSLEVHLPFLQACLQDFTLVPLVVGDATAEEVDEVLERLWGGPETLIVISSKSRFPSRRESETSPGNSATHGAHTAARSPTAGPDRL